ncbi:hypothetical protein LY474_31100 [Myxococcus stipitatus]|uniref:hypothetical protein n=1 Tax=Myxococcus stipitatus TaxID=83455 RepID=UPI001F3D343C|nr:hypothetical protein [Myxococcus stipitatus]MCE9672263.1 hypothetical protein [Myxococcus stipitatus]
MTPSTMQSQKPQVAEVDASEAHVKNNYVDCSTNVGVQRQRRPLPPPTTPALAR